MDNGDVSIRNLEGPFNCHLYVGFAPADKSIVLKLCARLQKQGVICYLRAMNDSIEESIQEGVGTSQKCLLFITSDYLKDAWCQIEMSAVIEKSRRFSRDGVIILKSEDLELTPESLREFTTDQFKPEKLNDEEFLAQFVDMITQEPNVKLDVQANQYIGYESALNYFYGYLCFILSGFKKLLIKETLKNDRDLVQKTVQKMLIIMPESCFCATELKSQDLIEFTGKFVIRFAHRAGNQKRDYKNSLYKLIDHERQEEYYFVGELATPLLTMFEAYSHGLCGMTKAQLYAGRDTFYFTLKALLSHPRNAECNDQFKLLYWSDPATEKPNQLDLYNFLLPVLRNEILLQQRNESKPSEVKTTNNDHILPLNRLPNTFQTVPIDGSNPASIYERVAKYPMDRRPRGLCLIVNIANFDNGVLLTREGAGKDEERLKKLFEDLHFGVQVHNDVSAQTLNSLLLDMQNTDHTNYDAFVCCILTHGKLGVIYTSDGHEVKILSLVDFFTDKNCPSLKGKPKMFFIQACQQDEPEPENGAAVNSLLHDGSVTQVELEIKEDAVGVQTVSMPDVPFFMTSKAVLIPGSPDFLMSYSTLPGSLSYRDEKTGSLYIQALNDCLREDEIDRALKNVTSRVKEKLRQQGEHDGVEERFQLPFHVTSGMDRLIYL